MAPLTNDVIVRVYALEFRDPDPSYAGLVYVGLTYGKRANGNPCARVMAHLERRTPESRRYLPTTNDDLLFAGVLDSHRFGDWPNAEADIVRSYMAAGWRVPQTNKNCAWPCEITDEVRLKISAARKGKKPPPFTPEHKRRIGMAVKARGPRTPEEKQKISASLKGRPGHPGRQWSPEERARMSLAQKGRPGRPWTPEMRAKMPSQKGRRGKPHTPESKAKLSAALKGKPHSPEWNAKVSAAKTGKKLGPISDWHRAQVSAAQKGRRHSPEHVAKVAEAHRGMKRSPEACANISAGINRSFARRTRNPK